MSDQNRIATSSQLTSPGNFIQPAFPIGNRQNFSMIYHRPPRDPFTLSAPPTTQISTLSGSSGLFLTPSVNSHTSFVPSRIGSSKLETQNMKPPKPPEKPLMPYMRYSRRMWEKVRLSNPDSKLWDIGKIIGQMWRELPESARQIYIEEYESEKLEYDKALKAYHNSPAYQAYLLNKNRGRTTEKPTSGAAESGVFIQPVDEDEEMGQFSLKQSVASRFHRNHRLMKEIFGETQVPDARNVITSQRLGVLKKQVNSLTLHQNKLEEELKQLEVKFENKKRKMADASAQFTVALKKICSQKVDPFEELVEKSKTYLLNAYEQYKLQEQKQREMLEERMSRLQSESDEAQAESNSAQDSSSMDQNQDKATTRVNASGTDSAPLEQLEGDAPNEIDQEGTRLSQADELPNDQPSKATASGGSLEQEDEDELSDSRDERRMDEDQSEPAKDVTSGTPSSPAPRDDSSENSQEA